MDNYESCLMVMWSHPRRDLAPVTYGKAYTRRVCVGEVAV
jgi:hypothetical protein